MNTEKEKQHYVPKFYLRNFSFEGNKKQIGVFNTITQFFISDAKLKTQAYKPFYYGRDGEMEEMLAELEDKLSPITNYIITTKSLPKVNSREYQLLLLFIVLTEARNPVISNTIVNHRKELIKRAKEIAPDDIFVETHIPEIPKEQTVKLALTSIKMGMTYCKDLQAKLLINSTEAPFITSDNPVAKYNQYLESRRWHFGWTGYACIGLQIFLPLSPGVAVALYDKWTYKIGDRKKNVINVNMCDVDQLNILQILNCETNVFFNERGIKQYLDSLYSTAKKYIKPNQATSQVMRNIDELGNIVENSKFINFGTTNPSMNLYLSVCTLTKHAKHHQFDDRAVQIRPTALATHQQLQSVKRDY
jgi:hypothetical protein